MNLVMNELKKIKFKDVKASELEYLFLRIQDAGGTVDSVTPEGDGEFTVVATIPTSLSSATESKFAN